MNTNDLENKITEDEAEPLSRAKENILEAVKVVKQKRCGKIKGRTYADGSKQHRYLKKFESVASPILSMDGLI